MKNLIWFLVILLVFIVLNSSYGWVNLQSVGDDISDGVTDAVGINPPVATGNPTFDTGVDLCSAYTTNYPTYFETKRLQCGAAGGDWICESDRAGCFDISTWDYVYACTVADDVKVLKAFCSTMDADWSCTATQVGCEK